MELTTEDGATVQDPRANDLQTALTRLGPPDNGFAVLATSPQNYIQVAGSKADGYLVEYREGSERTHQASMADDLPYQQVFDLLTAYASGGSWKSMVSWQSEVGVKRPATRPSRKRARKPTRGEKIFFALFFAIGATSLTFGAYHTFRTHQFLARAVEVPGKVERLVWNGDGYEPVVNYMDVEGRRLTFRPDSGNSPPSFYEGQGVKVVYDPADPEFPPKARIATFTQLWGLPVFAFVFGAGFSGVALACWVALSRRRQ